MSDLTNKVSSDMCGPSTADQKSDSDADPRDCSDESKVRLETALVYCEQLLLENNHIAKKPHAVIKEDVQMGEKIYCPILKIQAENRVVVPSDELIMCEEVDDGGIFEEVEGYSSSEADEDYEPDEEKAKTDADYIPPDYKIKVVKMAKEHPKWSLKSIQRKGGSRLKRMDQLKIWEEHIRSGGTAIDKYNTIDSRIYDRFVEARQSNKQVTTKDLQQWALSVASQFPNLKFNASEAWVKNFKRRHRIRQRKVTKSATKRRVYKKYYAYKIKNNKI